MFSTSGILIISGVFCLGLCGFLLYKLAPQEGRPRSAWTNTDFRGTSAAMGLLILMITGISLVVKGIVS
jgi:hypothetical protein